MRLEVVLLGLFVVVWCVALLSVATGLPLAGLAPLSLYQLYGVAAAAGWLGGNLYVRRARKLPPMLRRRVLLIYLMGPPSMVYLLRTMGWDPDTLVSRMGEQGVDEASLDEPRSWSPA